MTGLEEGELFLRFDALGNHALLEVLAHINYGAHDGRVIGIGGYLADKGLVTRLHVALRRRVGSIWRRIRTARLSTQLMKLAESCIRSTT